MSYEEMGFAKLDTEREKRTGFPEVVFCEGKPDKYLLEIYKKLLSQDGRVFGTRASKAQYELIKKEIPQVQYDEVSRILRVESDITDSSKKVIDADTQLTDDNRDKSAEDKATENKPAENKSAEGRSAEDKTKKNYVVVCTGGTADIPVAEEAAQTAEYFGAKVERIYDVGVSGIHRVLSKKEILQGACCVVTVAGMEGALASVIGGLVSNPVIAVPTSVGYGASFGGMSALLTMINSCANGITVVNIDNGYGAGYVATQIYRLSER